MAIQEVRRETSSPGSNCVGRKVFGGLQTAHPSELRTLACQHGEFWASLQSSQPTSKPQSAMIPTGWNLYCAQSTVGCRCRSRRNVIWGSRNRQDLRRTGRGDRRGRPALFRSSNGLERHLARLKHKHFFHQGTVLYQWPISLCRRWRDLDVSNPFTGGIAIRAATATVDDFNRAIDAPQEAFAAWASLPASDSEEALRIANDSRPALSSFS